MWDQNSHFEFKVSFNVCIGLVLPCQCSPIQNPLDSEDISSLDHYNVGKGLAISTALNHIGIPCKRHVGWWLCHGTDGNITHFYQNNEKLHTVKIFLEQIIDGKLVSFPNNGYVPNNENDYPYSRTHVYSKNGNGLS